MPERRVIGVENIEAARQRGLAVLEILPGDIVTGLARETASRTGIKLLDGPIERVQPLRTDGVTAMRRGLYRRSPKWMAPGQTAAARIARRFSRLAVVGAGGVGANIAHLVANADIADQIVLIDILPGSAAATALDLNHASGISNSRSRCVGSENLSDIAGAQVIVVTAGQARTPGMSRSALVEVNRRIIDSTAQAIRTQASDAIVIVVTNPLDEMTMAMLRTSGLPRERVLGMAGTLDSGRFRNALAAAAGVASADVEAITLGSHGDEMTPISSLAKIKGRPLRTFLNQQQIDACVDEAVNGGAQVVNLRKSGSATIAPAHATLQLLNHLRGAASGFVPVSVMMQGEYGVSDVVLGVPAHLGMNGLIRIEQLKLSDNEMMRLHAAAQAIRTRIDVQ